MTNEKEISGFSHNMLWLFLGSLALITPVMAALYYFWPTGAVMYTKELIVMLGIPVFFFITNKRNLETLWLPILPVALYLAVAFFFSEANVKANLAAIRQLLYPFIFIFIGFAVASKINRFILNKQIIRFTLLLIAIGIVMILLGKNAFHWTEPYFNAKGVVMGIESGYPSHWEEPDFNYLPRMASSFFDPINFGHYLVFALFCVVLNKAVKRSVPLIAIVAFTILATICKGAWLQALIVFGMCFFPIRINQKIKVVGLLAIPVLVIILANYHLGIKYHLIGISTAIETIKPFGYGLGETGNVSLIFGSVSFPAIYDTYIGGLIGQIGIVGLLIWLLPLVVFLYKIRTTDQVLMWVIIAQLIVGVYSENAMNPLSVAFPFTWLGITLYKSQFNSENEA